MTTAVAARAGSGVLPIGPERVLGTVAERLRKAWADHRALRASVAQLKALSDRQLADVGIARAAIRAHARTAIYGS